MGRATIGPLDPASALLGRDLAPPSGRVALGGRFPGLKPGLKPWAEFCRPFGAQNKGLSPDCGLQPVRSKMILSLSSRHSDLSPKRV